MAKASITDGAWDAIEVWWGERFGEAFLAHLRPGVERSRLDELEKLVGRPLPADFRSAYQRHDGQEEFYEHAGEGKLVPGLCFGLPLMPLDEIEHELDNWRSTIAEIKAAGELAELDADQASVPEAHVKLQHMNPLWVPFASDSGGNFLAIDLDPDSAGAPGQVINMGPDEHTKYVIAESFGAFLSYVAAELRGGNYTLVEDEPGEWALNIGTPEGTEHYFDALPVLFGDDDA